MQNEKEPNKDSNTTQNKSQERDLASELKTLTANKKPSMEKPPTWNFGEEVEQEKPPVNGTVDSEGKTTVAKRASEEEIKNGALAGAAAVEMLSSLVSEGIINLRYYRKFTPEERDALNDTILDKPENKRTEAEQILSNKWERLMERRDKKLDRVKMSETAKQRLEFGFRKHAEITGKAIMSPKAVLNITIGEAFIKSIFEAFMD